MFNLFQNVSSYSIFLKFVDKWLVWDPIESFFEGEENWICDEAWVAGSCQTIHEE